MGSLAASVAANVLEVLVVLAVAVVSTAISLRLLGLRRGWVGATIAGGIGFGIAFVLALGLDDWDWGSDQLALRTLAIGVPATMAVAVTLDLLARPGSLAIGERAGLVTGAAAAARNQRPRRCAAPVPRAGSPRTT